jgi:hypothetical protein
MSNANDTIAADIYGRGGHHFSRDAFLSEVVIPSSSGHPFKRWSAGFAECSGDREGKQSRRGGAAERNSSTPAMRQEARPR